MAHLTNFSFEFFYEIFTEDAPLLFQYEQREMRLKNQITEMSEKLTGLTTLMERQAIEMEKRERCSQRTEKFICGVPYRSWR